MTDENKNPEPDKVVSVTIQRAGKEVEIRRAESGKFVAKERGPKAIDGKKRREELRRFLNGRDKPGVNKTRWMEMMEAGFEIIKLGKTDQKFAMAAAKWYELLSTRAYGKPAPSDEEIEAMTTQGVKFVRLQQPELMHKEVIVVDGSYHQPPSKPSFALTDGSSVPKLPVAEVTEIRTNEPTKTEEAKSDDMWVQPSKYDR
jgi:hypothetical protein